MMRAAALLFTDRFAIVADDSGAQLYTANASALSAVRTGDLARAGVPVETLRELWAEADRLREVCRLAALATAEQPHLFFIDREGHVRDCYVAVDSWFSIVERLRKGVAHAA
jgi:hypothetical protein